jgi:hypothetical protein
VLQNHPWASANKAYHPVRIEETFGIAQGGGGDSEGWKVAMDLLNHVPQQAVL